MVWTQPAKRPGYRADRSVLKFSKSNVTRARNIVYDLFFKLTAGKGIETHGDLWDEEMNELGNFFEAARKAAKGFDEYEGPAIDETC
jgi:hypothetical protein